MTVKIKLRRDTYTNWYNANPILALGEPSYDTTNNKIKVGDGSNSWRNLEYLTGSSGAGAGYTGSAGTNGYTGSASTVAGPTGYTGSAGTNGYTGSASTVAGPTGYTGSATRIPTGGTTGQVLTKNSGTDYDAGWATPSGGGGSGLTSRTTANVTTSSLANGASGNASITGFKGYGLYKIQTSAAAWVVIYDSVASRTADINAARDQNTDPLPGSGVIAEAITTGAQTIKLSPGTIGFSDETSPTTAIPIKVTNLSGSSTTITVTLTLLCLEV
jgi:hypothetical protein